MRQEWLATPYGPGNQRRLWTFRLVVARSDDSITNVTADEMVEDIEDDAGVDPSGSATDDGPDRTQHVRHHRQQAHECPAEHRYLRDVPFVDLLIDYYSNIILSKFKVYYRTIIFSDYQEDMMG